MNKTHGNELFQHRFSLESTFWCPSCHSAALVAETVQLSCPGCSRAYPVVGEVPILINDNNSVFAIADYVKSESYTGASYGSDSETASGLRRLYRKFAHSLSEFGIKPAHMNSEEAMAQVCQMAVSRQRILVIGAGDMRYPDIADFVYSDVAITKGVTLIADAHDLPFASASFDMVLSIAVLEHVASPPRVTEEIWRVLKPQGYVYAATPFLQPVHMGAYDFTRFTHLGHRRLFRQFSEVSSGLALGPAAVLAWSLRSLLSSFSANKTYRRIANLAGLVITFPLKYLDYLTRRNAAAIDGAGGVYFFGRKQETTISDRDLIKLYRGGY
jgi:SAM-dependent methyltransferase/uncharacterized protein YbaR (Trm112 family)